MGFEILPLLLMLLLLVLLMLPRWVNIERRSLHSELSPELNTKPLSHGEVHYQLSGADNGPVVVLIHGFSIPGYVWELNQQALTDAGFRVLVFDLYGRGYSARPNTAYSLSLFSHQLDELLTSLAIHKPVHLVGLSMGAAIAASFASTYPHKVDKVALIAPWNQALKIPLLRIPLLNRYLVYVFYVPKMARDYMHQFVSEESLVNWQQRYRQQIQIKGFRNALYSTLIHTLHRDPSDVYQEIRSEVLLIWGDKDPFVPISQADRLRSLLAQNHQYIVIPGGDHGLIYHQASEVNQALVSFFKRG